MSDSDVPRPANLHEPAPQHSYQRVAVLSGGKVVFTCPTCGRRVQRWYVAGVQIAPSFWIGGGMVERELVAGDVATRHTIVLGDDWPAWPHLTISPFHQLTRN